MLLSCVQSHVAFGNVSDNFRRTIEWLQQAVARSVDLVVLPECMLTGYGYESRDEALDHAMTATDPTWEKLISICRSSGHLHVVIGFLEREESDGQTQLYNA